MNPCMLSKYQHNIYTFYLKKEKSKKSNEDSQQNVSWIQEWSEMFEKKKICRGHCHHFEISKINK